MAKNKLKNLIELVISCVVAIVVTVAAIMYLVQDNAYAWFAKNDQVSADGMNVAVESPTSVIDDDGVSYYLYNETVTENNVDKYVFKNNNDTAFQGYSILDNNIYQAILKIKVKSTVTTVSVSAALSNDTTFYLGDNDMTHLLDGNVNNLSSIISFELYSSNENYIEQSTATDSSSGEPVTLTLSVPDTIETSNFIDKDGNSLVQNISFGAIEFSPSDSNFVYVVMKYNSDAINEIFTKNIGTDYMKYIEQQYPAIVPFENCDFSIHVV